MKKMIVIIALAVGLLGKLEAQSFLVYEEYGRGGGGDEFFNVFLYNNNDTTRVQLADAWYIFARGQSYGYAVNPFVFLEYKDSILIFWEDIVVIEGGEGKKGWEKYLGDFIERAVKREVYIIDCCSICNGADYVAYIAYFDKSCKCSKGLAVKIDTTTDTVVKRIEFSATTSEGYRRILNGKPVPLENKYIFIDSYDFEAYAYAETMNDAKKLFSAGLIDLNLNVSSFDYSDTIADLIWKARGFVVFPYIQEDGGAGNAGFFLAYSLQNDALETYRIRQYEYNEKLRSFNLIVNPGLKNKKFGFYEIGDIPGFRVVPFLKNQNLKGTDGQANRKFRYIWPRYEVRNVPLLLSAVSKLDSGYVDAAELQKIQYWFPQDSTWFSPNTNGRRNFGFYGDNIINLYEGMKIVIYDQYILLFLNNDKYTYEDFKNYLYHFTSLKVDPETGYRYFEIFDESYGEYMRMYLLSGKDIMVLVKTEKFNGAEQFSWGFDHFELIFSMEQMLQRRKKFMINGEYVEHEYLDSGIKTISASSYLTETIKGKKVEYKPEYMINRICKLPEKTDERGFPVFDEGFPIFDNFKPCWAEGVPGDGIGEWLQVEFIRPSDEIMILNGYVDFRNMSAYMNNNRLKKIRIESERPAFSIEYTLPDYVAYHSVPLPQKTTKVKITILEVYKGLKYSDTCVTAIALPQERSRSIEEEKRWIYYYLKKKNVFEYINQYLKE